MKETIKYELERIDLCEDIGFDEVLLYVVKDSNEHPSFCVMMDIGETHGIDGIGIRKVWIPISPHQEDLSIPSAELNEILALLEDEGKVESGEAGHANIPYDYYFALEEPHRISTAYYQDRYYDEIAEWLRKFLAENGTVARILSMVRTTED